MRGLVVGIAATGIAGQLILVLLVGAAALSIFGVQGPLALVRRTIRGGELWLAFGIAAFATMGSLFFSQVAHFIPCNICWYQRYCMYPLPLVLLPIAVRGARWAARWVLPIPLVGASLSVYHVLIEQGLAPQFAACIQSLCGLRWINEFGFVTIPTLAFTAFAIVISLLMLATANPVRQSHY